MKISTSSRQLLCRLRYNRLIITLNATRDYNSSRVGLQGSLSNGKIIVSTRIVV